MRTFLTGAGGFSGSYLAQRLVAEGHSVLAHVGRARNGGIGRLDPAVAENPAVTVLRGDLAELSVLPGTVDGVIHAGAISQCPAPELPVMLRSNVQATQQVIARSMEAGATRIVYFSSMSVYGGIQSPVVDEATPFNHPDIYGTSKYLGELALKELGTSARSLSFRLPGVLGPGAVRNFVAMSVLRAWKGEPLYYFGADNPFNNAVHVADLADLALGYLQSEAQPAEQHDAVVLGAGGSMTMGDVILAAAKAWRGTGDPVFDERPSGGKRGFRLEYGRAETLYGYRPQPVAEMVARFVDEQIAYFTENGCD